MMILHTGKLTAEINGQQCTFNGNAWTTPDASLSARLNQSTDCSPKHHFDIRTLAEHVLRDTGLLESATILDVENDTLDEDLEEGSID